MMATNLGALDDSGEVRPRADSPKGLELGFGVPFLIDVQAVSLDRVRGDDEVPATLSTSRGDNRTASRSKEGVALPGCNVDAA
jgi:hypothetical protein